VKSGKRDGVWQPIAVRIFLLYSADVKASPKIATIKTYSTRSLTQRIMKKSIFTLCLLLLVAGSTFGNEYVTKSKELGIVAYLTTIKSLAEYKMISIASDQEYTKQIEKAGKFRSKYNMLKLSTDKLIHQLSADLIDKNSLRKYRKLNKYLKGDWQELHHSLSGYKSLIKEIDSQIESFLGSTYSSSLAGPEFGDIVGGIELVHTAITDARNFREKKVQSMIGILGNLKLEKVKDLTEKKEKD